MNKTKKTSIFIALFGLFIGISAFGNDASTEETGRRRHTPPPEAYAACEGKSIGDTAEFEGRRGNTVTGTCEQEGDRLVLRPDRSKRRFGRRRHTPPPEAYAACEGKNIGDTAEFEGRRGNTVTGTCEQEGDQLVLRPDRSKRRFGRRHHTPPPEAYAACEGKNIGDTAEFEGRNGNTVTGTCEQEGDQLVLRPDRGKGNTGDRSMDDSNS